MEYFGKMERLKGLFNNLRLFLKDAGNAGWLALLLPFALLIPNVALNFTEGYPLLTAITNVVMPLGAYMLLMSTWCGRVGVVTLCCLPLMALAFGQIVQLYVYGESILSVDMFLSIVASNPSEATELMANLVLPMGITSAFYISFLVWGVIAVFKKWQLSESFQRMYRVAAMWISGVGLLLTMICYSLVGGYNADIHMFPVNVCENIVTAFHRTAASLDYPETSAAFRHNATSIHGDTIGREIYVLVIGETSRADNWQLMGYKRKTNPQLSRMERLVSFPRALSQCNTTHKSVPMILSGVTAANFDSINYRKGIISAFREAGFYTTFVSNQRRNRSYIEYLGSEADNVVYLGDDGKKHLDGEMVEYVAKQLADSSKTRQLIVLHAYGSHFNYRDRYSDDFRCFTPDETMDANWLNRSKLLNAYDNSICYTDDYLARVMRMVESAGCSGAVMYLSDHGEDIFDDERNRFLHSSPTPTAHQLRVPMLVWLSLRYDSLLPHQRQALETNQDKFVSSTSAAFHTLIDLAGLKMAAYSDTASLASPAYFEPSPEFLTDRNELVPLDRSGLKPQDLNHLRVTSVLQ